MKLLKFNTYEEMSKAAADIIADVMNSKEEPVLGLATGSTPIGMYNCLVEMNKAGKIDFSKVKSVNLDEYYPITPDNDQSYRYFMNYHLFDKVNINKANTRVPDGTAKDPDAHCKAYEDGIDALGGIDVQILGIGRNGHVGFNEPGAELFPFTHLTELTPSTIEANSRFFTSEDDVPKHALTMGMRSIFKARKILLLVSGENKAEAVKKMLAAGLPAEQIASIMMIPIEQIEDLK